MPSGGSIDAILGALGWMAREHVPVVNISLVGPPNTLLENVTRAMVARGHLLVAAVGNDGPAAKPLYPAAYPGVIGVTGVDENGACCSKHVVARRWILQHLAPTWLRPARRHVQRSPRNIIRRADRFSAARIASDYPRRPVPPRREKARRFCHGPRQPRPRHIMATAWSANLASAVRGSAEGE